MTDADASNMTQTKMVTRNGKVAVEITCSCSTHPAGKSSAVVVDRTSFPADRIHGFVLMANHPALSIRMSAERKGIFGARP
jgi:hypothetical protein